MIAAWWFQAVVISTALALAGWGSERILAAWGLPRRWAWVAAALGTAALVLASPLREAGTVPDQVARSAEVATSTWSSVTGLSARLAALTFPNLDTPLALLWLGSALIGLGFVTWSLRRVATRMHRAPEVALHGMMVRLTQHDGPMVVGLRTPEIVVPEALLRRDPHDVQLVLAHEASHRAARDPLLLALFTGLVALMPGLPALWFMRSRLRVAIEIDCDRRVIGTHRTDRARYGALLLALASRRTLVDPLPMGLSLHPSSLERRIVAMTARTNRRWIPLLAIPAALGTFIACQAPLPTTEANPPATRMVLDGVEEEVALKTPSETVEMVTVPDHGLLEKVVLDESATKQALRLQPSLQVEGVKIQSDSLIEVRVEPSRRVPLQLKEVEGRRVP